jgi:hypothetical protein
MKARNMSEEEFKEAITYEYKTDNTVNYILCIAIIILGVYFLYQIYVDFESSQSKYAWLVLLLPLMLFSEGFYLLWRISKDYLISIVPSTKPISEKVTIIDDYLSLSKNEIIWNERNYEIIQIRYKNRFYNYVDLNIYIDNEKFMFNAQGVDRRRPKGMIDFGLTKRANIKFKRFLRENA